MINGGDSPKWFIRDYALSLFGKNNDKDLPSLYQKSLCQYLEIEFDESEGWKVDDLYRESTAQLPSHIKGEERIWLHNRINEYRKMMKNREILTKIPRLLDKLLNDACTIHRMKRSVFEKNVQSKSMHICRVIKLFSHWAINLAGYSGVVVGAFVKRTSVSVSRFASLGKDIELALPKLIQ